MISPSLRLPPRAPRLDASLIFAAQRHRTIVQHVVPPRGQLRRVRAGHRAIVALDERTEEFRVLIVSGYGRVCVLLNQHAAREQLVAMRDFAFERRHRRYAPPWPKPRPRDQITNDEVLLCLVHRFPGVVADQSGVNAGWSSVPLGQSWCRQPGWRRLAIRTLLRAATGH